MNLRDAWRSARVRRSPAYQAIKAGASARSEEPVTPYDWAHDADLTDFGIALRMAARAQRTLGLEPPDDEPAPQLAGGLPLPVPHVIYGESFDRSAS